MVVAKKQHSGALPLPVMVTIALVMVALTVGYFLLQQSRERRPSTPVLTQEATAYLPNLQLSDVDMKAAENYLHQTATTITGKITNNGLRTVRLVEVHCLFRDLNGQVVLREWVTIVGRKTGPVPTGQTRAFELNFDNIPATWNQAMPGLVISQMQFQE